MALELTANAGQANTGLTTYFVVWNTVGQVRSTGTTFATDNATNRNAGAITATESVNGVYKADSPAFAAGLYYYALYQRVGGSPAVTDTLLSGPGKHEWDGSAVVPLSSRATQTSVDAVQADLPQRITKNTALSGFAFFVKDSSDHVSGKTGLTVTAARSLDGAAFASCANAVSEIGNGWYKIDLAAADLNGNVVALYFTASGADPVAVTVVTEPT